MEEMKRFGIYVPEKDADWEKGGGGSATDEGEAYESLLERHDNCDAEECVCPEGRKKDEDYTEWEIVSDFPRTADRSVCNSFSCVGPLLVLRSPRGPRQVWQPPYAGRTHQVEVRAVH